MLLNLDKISLSGGTQARSELNQEHISQLLERIESRYELPPVDLIFDGSTYWLVDGFHRVEAHKLAGHNRINASVSQGTQRDAILKSLGANATHGLPRNNGDRKRAVLRMLNDDEWSQWPNAKIAETCACTTGYVKRLRLETLPTIPGLPEPEQKAKPSPTTAKLQSATPGAIVEVDGSTGTIMDITDGGVIYQVLVEGKLKPLLRNEFKVQTAAPPKEIETKPTPLSRQQQILELKRFVVRVSKAKSVPAEIKAEAIKLLELFGN